MTVTHCLLKVPPYLDCLVGPVCCPADVDNDQNDESWETQPQQGEEEEDHLDVLLVHVLGSLGPLHPKVDRPSPLLLQQIQNSLFIGENDNVFFWYILLIITRAYDI